MAGRYKILWKGGTGELVEKKSRFISTTEPVTTEAEAAAFVERIRKKYWDARHNCYAYVLGEQGRVQKCSDDGEPSQTAGRPILDVLLGEGVRDVCLVVTRYFGGVLLGTGGLVRAYSGAAQEGLRNSEIVEKCPGRCMEITADYTEIGKIQYILAQEKLAALDTKYTEKVEVSVMVPEEELSSLKARITEGTAGRVQISVGEPVDYALTGGEVILL